MFQYSYAIIAWFVFREIFHLEEQNHISGFWIIEDFLLSKSKCSSHEKIPTRNWARNTRAFVISKQNNHDFLALPSSKHNFMLKINVSENVSERWNKFHVCFLYSWNTSLASNVWSFSGKLCDNFVYFLPASLVFTSSHDARCASRVRMTKVSKCSNEIVKRKNVKCEKMSKEYM